MVMIKEWPCTSTIVLIALYISIPIKSRAQRSFLIDSIDEYPLISPHKIFMIP